MKTYLPNVKRKKWFFLLLGVFVIVLVLCLFPYTIGQRIRLPMESGELLGIVIEDVIPREYRETRNQQEVEELHGMFFEIELYLCGFSSREYEAADRVYLVCGVLPTGEATKEVRFRKGSGFIDIGALRFRCVYEADFEQLIQIFERYMRQGGGPAVLRGQQPRRVRAGAVCHWMWTWLLMWSMQ